MAAILAIDYGQQRVGLALGDDAEGFVVTLPALRRTSDRALAEAIAETVTTRGITHVVVGSPLTLAGGASAQTVTTHVFAHRLRQIVSVPVTEHDERLTTQLAHRLGRRKNDDSAAAALLLTSYMEHRRLV